MFTFLAAWLVFPLLFAALTLGSGLLVERIGGFEMPVSALFGVGFCALVCMSQVVTRPGISGVLAPLAAVLMAGAGLWLGRARVRRVPRDRPAVVMAVALFLVFAAPALLTLEPTWLGYQNLGDAAFHFALVDRLMSHGPSVAGLTESSYSDILNNYFVTAYPTGAHTVLGSVRALMGIDVAWIFQPYLSMLAVTAALSMRAIVLPALGRRGLAALVAFTAGQASLLYSYANNEQSLKELATLVCIVTAVTVARPLVAAAPSWRAGLPLAIVVGGSLGVLNLALAPWIGPLVLALFVILLVRHARRRAGALAAESIVFAAVAAAFAIPSLIKLQQFVSVTNVALTSAGEFGNLTGPLSFARALGAWPAADFRLPLPVGIDGAYLVVGGFALAAVLGLAAALGRRAWDVLLLAAISLIGFLAVAGRASPWAYGKALMILSPAVVLLAALGAAGLWRERRRAEGLIIGVVLAIGLIWTNAQTYHNVDAAPYDRLEELTKVDHRFADRGPLVYFEFEEFAKHFLRDTAPTGVVEGYRPGFPVAAPKRPSRFGFSSDVDDWDAATVVDHYPLVLLRRGPLTSRPPSAYERVWKGHYYEVWKRRRGALAPLAHLPLGDRYSAAATPKCSRVRTLANRARRDHGSLVVAPRTPGVAARVTRAPAPFKWTVDANDPDTWRPLGEGRVETRVTTPGGRFDVALEASVGRRVHVSVDGREVGSVAHEMSPRRTTLAIGSVQLQPGRHVVTVFQEGGSLDPRAGGSNRLIGPVYLTPRQPSTLRTVAPADWKSICGRPADWVEAVR